MFSAFVKVAAGGLAVAAVGVAAVVGAVCVLYREYEEFESGGWDDGFDDIFSEADGWGTW